MLCFFLNAQKMYLLNFKINFVIILVFLATLSFVLSDKLLLYIVVNITVNKKFVAVFRPKKILFG